MGIVDISINTYYNRILGCLTRYLFRHPIDNYSVRTGNK